MILCLKGSRWNGDILDHHGQKKQRRHNPEKIMATIFWDRQGILLADFKERNTTVTAEYYAYLIYKLMDANKDKRR
jgi:hypothetical protein